MPLQVANTSITFDLEIRVFYLHVINGLINASKKDSAATKEEINLLKLIAEDYPKFLSSVLTNTKEINFDSLSSRINTLLKNNFFSGKLSPTVVKKIIEDIKNNGKFVAEFFKEKELETPKNFLDSIRAVQQKLEVHLPSPENILLEVTATGQNEISAESTPKIETDTEEGKRTYAEFCFTKALDALEANQYSHAITHINNAIENIDSIENFSDGDEANLIKYNRILVAGLLSFVLKNLDGYSDEDYKNPQNYDELKEMLNNLGQAIDILTNLIDIQVNACELDVDKENLLLDINDLNVAYRKLIWIKINIKVSSIDDTIKLITTLMKNADFFVKVNDIKTVADIYKIIFDVIMSTVFAKVCPIFVADIYTTYAVILKHFSQQKTDNRAYLTASMIGYLEKAFSSYEAALADNKFSPAESKHIVKAEYQIAENFYDEAKYFQKINKHEQAIELFQKAIKVLEKIHSRVTGLGAAGVSRKLSEYNKELVELLSAVVGEDFGKYNVSQMSIFSQKDHSKEEIMQKIVADATKHCNQAP